MKVVKTIRINLWPALMVLGLGIALSSCVSTQPYIRRNVSNTVSLQHSDAHNFKYVNVTRDDGELVIYGKIVHNHIRCDSEGHVDLVIVNEDKTPAYSTAIPVVKRSSRQQGWYGAAFRARIPFELNEQQEVRLAFHDEGCVTTQTFDCDDNQAVPAFTN